MRLVYTTTLDESLESFDRMVRQMPFYRNRRTRHLASTAVSFTVLMTIVVVWRARLPLSLLTVCLVTTASTLCAVIFTFAYSRLYYDWALRRHARAALSALLGPSDTIAGETELRPDSIWTRENGVEVALPWTQITEIRDAGDAVELWSKTSLYTLRYRWFVSVAEREAFLARATHLMTAHSPGRYADVAPKKLPIGA